MEGKLLETTVGEVCQVFDGPHATPTRLDVGPVFLGITSLNKGRIDLAASDHVSEEDFTKWTRRVTPKPGDVVFSYETKLGEAAIIPEGLRCCLGRRMGLMRPDPKKLDSRFLLFYYLGAEFQEVIRERTIHGSTVERLSLNEFPQFPLRIPPLAEQKAIAAVLGALDDKIELNRRMNATLEAMARALFQSWFVDFDPIRAKLDGRKPIGLDETTAALFPEHLEDSPLGHIPKGWKVGNIQDCCVQIQNGGTPRRNETRFWDGGDIPWLASGEIRQPIITATESFITEEGLAESSAKWVPAFSTVVALYGATAGQVSFTSSRLTTNQAVCALIPKKDFTFFNYLTMRGATAELENKAVGSAQQNISKGIVEETRVVLPPPLLVERFTEVARPLFEQWISNLHQSRTLATLRDTLLPKLLSGELSVAETEKEASA
jgi:type I restriction enzyme S subunit